MQQIPLGKTELSVSPLGYGAAPIGFLDTEIENVGRVLNFLLDHGVTLLDTAAAYKGSEEAIGQTVGHRRDDFVLVSKCGMGGVEAAEFDNDPWHPGAIGLTIDRSLERLKTDHLDVCLLHTCPQDVLEKGEVLGALVEARDAGKVRFAGYSGDNAAGVYAASLPDIAVIETSVNFCDQANLDTVIPACQANDVGVIAKRPIANAAWKNLSDQRGMYQNYASEYHRRFNKMGITPHDLGYHGHPEVEWPEIALKFTLAQQGVHTAICGTTSLENAEHNLAAANKNPLREEVVEKLKAAFAAARDGDPEGDWTGRT
ncbi:MAG: aldo/keto reductase [Planctomycetota bacterium]